MRMTAEMFDITLIKVDVEVIGLVLKYNMNKYGDARTDPNTYIDIMREMLPPEFEEISMSIAKALEARGKKEGIVIGKTEGIAIGEARGIDHTLQAIDLLKSGTHSLDEIAQKTALLREAVEKLQHSMLN